MAIPDYQSLMLPLMRLAADEDEHRLSEAVETLAAQLGLTLEERNERLPSGVQPKFDNRVGWARTYLTKAGLLESTGRGKFRITMRGKQVLRGEPAVIDVQFLKQFPEFLGFIGKSQDLGEHRGSESDPEVTSTPEEVLASSYLELRRSLAHDLLQRVKQCSPKFFERLVVELVVAMGYGGSIEDAGRAIGRSGDGGVDGIIKEDRLGLDVVYLQAKRWEGTVGRPVVQAFAGSLEGHRARKGILITTSQFSSDAQEYVTRIEKKIVLIDGEHLANLMIDFNVGVTEAARYVVKRIDNDYFDEA
ncbi:restriction endonuclease [Alicyclobacillus sp.]|uniref:restriction endonuclease n=1 Tax=Alicyclobacillus sp. TaxID=61169 RepID=UPI0025BA7193|nr:restriction endonuclease [Alicyclobacillus sp.]MCL6515316.1 restriction endonuclease [Alicyclobacillus sp.]